MIYSLDLSGTGLDWTGLDWSALCVPSYNYRVVKSYMTQSFDRMPILVQDAVIFKCILS